MVLEAKYPATIQDLGRFGVGHLGLAQGGALDLHAHCWANKLLSNSTTAATLEIINGSIKFRVIEDTQIAVTGANTPLFINGEATHLWKVHQVKSGQTIELTSPVAGQINYLALVGGIKAKVIQKSKSTVIRDKIGQLISASALLSSDAKSTRASLQTETPKQYIPKYNQNVVLNIILGYQYANFGNKYLKDFLNTKFKASNKKDRMGLQLIGGTKTPPQSSLISEGIALGSVQITPDGTPIILLNDHQTLGGYPKLGCIAQSDLNKVAQSSEMQTIEFKKINRKLAQQKWRQFVNFFDLNI